MHGSDKKKIRRVALDHLARRNHSEHSLAQKLKIKGFMEKDIEAIISDLAQEGLINNKLFTENYIYYRRGKGYGPKRIQIELEVHKIDSDMIAELLNIPDNAWLSAAEKLWRKHFKNKFPADLKTRAKQIRFLQYRGYTREQIDSVIPGRRSDEES